MKKKLTHLFSGTPDCRGKLRFFIWSGVVSYSSSDELEHEESLEEELESLEESDVMMSSRFALSAISATSGRSFRKILKTAKS